MAKFNPQKISSIKGLIAKLIKKSAGKLSYIIPKKKNYFLFSLRLNQNKFSGNIKALMLYINETIPNQYKAVLFTNSENTKKEAEALGIKTIGGFINEVWALLRAEVIFIDAYYPHIRNGNYKFVQLWHGSGFKNVGYMWEKSTFPKNMTKEEYYQKMYKNCLLVASTSEIEAEKQNRSFLTPNVAVTGYPRNDILFDNEKAEEIKKKFQLEKYSKIIAYTPTHRDGILFGAEVINYTQPFTDNFWKALHEHLEETNSIFIVKRHPTDFLLKVPDNYKNIKDYTDTISDVQELILITDLMISDYSSIITDYAILDRPIIIYAYDFDNYNSHVRSLYFDLHTTLPKPFVEEENELLNKIKDNAWWQEKEVQDSYKKFQRKFHKYLDNQSSKRVMDEVIKRLNKK